MKTEQKIRAAVVQCLADQFQKSVDPETISLSETRKEFPGDITVTTFPLAKLGIGSPEKIGESLGNYLRENLSEVSEFNVVKGFLNISLSEAYWFDFFHSIKIEDFVRSEVGKGQKVIVEFSSPNTNKPLHLGHLRNNFLGDSVSRILAANGFEVIKACLYNDRGIAICKSMVAFRREANGATPGSTGKKPDHFVVDYYVRFASMVIEETIAELVNLGFEEKAATLLLQGKGKDLTEEDKAALGQIKSAMKERGIELDQLKENTPAMKEAREMLLEWEAGQPEVIALWKKLNDWVYEGFKATYERIYVTFDHLYYESQTYLTGNDLIAEGLEKGVFFTKEDGSVWIDLTADKLDMKVVRRADGTSMYITQDIGTAESRATEYGMNKSVYVVADEQDYHFKVLFLIMKKLGREWADGMYHLSYGMVDLPSGRMKSREGTVVDADDLLNVVRDAVEVETQEKGRIEGLSDQQLQELYEMIGVGALKFFILRVKPDKRMVFDPEESVNLYGDTGPFVSYAHARARSILRKVDEMGIGGESRKYASLADAEKSVLRQIAKYPDLLVEAAQKYDPSLIAAFALDLAKEFNRMVHEVHVLRAENPDASRFRYELSQLVAELIRHSMGLLGIKVPDQM
ncbi:MAG: arginine--tRNA ligase [Bacteroidia bacterium]|nr:arginine--tRNA ligase [Bacteroidia bacterium]